MQVGQKDICTDCREDMPLTYFWDWLQNPAYERLAASIEIHSAVSLFFFRELAGYNRIVHSIKYEGNRNLGRKMGRLLGEKISVSAWMSDLGAVVPVPLHPLRRFRRGYNQAELISEGIAEVLGIPVVKDVVRRMEYTGTQTKLHGSEKRRNVSGVFSADAEVMRRMAERGIRHILVVDDVMTTGATLTECAKVLSKQFQISAATLAFVEEEVRAGY